LKHKNKILAPYKIRQMKYLKYMSEILTKTLEKALKTYATSK
jgi:hypothetical protein